MPHLRFSRDKRGYENTFVVHSDRRRGKPHARILYWFRTPPGVRVGRSALDEDAIRLIEESNPEVEFDWTRILKGGPEPKPPEPERPVRPVRPPAARSDSGQTRSRARYDARAGSDWGQTGVRPGSDPSLTPVEPQSDPGLTPTSEEFDPLLSGGDPAFGLDEAEVEEGPSALEIPPAALVRLGSEGLSRLRARHAEILARIAERVPDPARREELKSRADRLNPDTWVTDEEVTSGLEQYEAVFDSLRAIVGRKRRRRRRRGGAGTGDVTAGPETDEAEHESEPDPGEPGPDSSV